jgi:sulfur-oxidizing protein SoxX
MNTKRIAVIAGAAAVAAGCATMMGSNDETHAKALAMLKSSFKEQGQAKLDRLDQDQVQRMCSDLHDGKVLSKEAAADLEKAQLALVRYPADGKYLGDWKAGERLAQTGVGMQYTDDPKAATGGNCYACHQLTKAEVSFGTIGPSLYNFAKLRGYTPEMQKYAYGKVYNSQAFAACSSMPRFGHMRILDEKQIKDVVALLMDPDSPVNK